MSRVAWRAQIGLLVTVADIVMSGAELVIEELEQQYSINAFIKALLKEID